MDIIFQNNSKWDYLKNSLENNARIETYLPDVDIEAEVDINWNAKENDFIALLNQNKVDYKDIEFKKNNKGKFNGTVYLVLDKTNAKKLSAINGIVTYNN